MSDGGGGDVEDSLKQEAALSVDVDHLTSDPPETLRELDVHRQLQAEKMINNFIDQTVSDGIDIARSLIGSLLLPIFSLLRPPHQNVKNLLQ